MKGFSIIDLLLRKINSFLFRLVLIAYSIFILIAYENILPTYTYVILIVAYVVCYVALSKSHVLRLVNDFLLIIIATLGKSPNELFIFVFTLLPIINCINFSGTKKSRTLYLFTIITYYALLFYYTKEVDFRKISILPLACLFFLWLIELYTSKRIRVRNFIENMNEFVDGFYLNKEYFEKPHKIYPKLRDKINQELKKPLVTDIYCFIKTKLPNSTEKLLMVNSSKFVWNYSLKGYKIISQISKNGYLTDFSVRIGDELYPCNIILQNKIEDTEYIFILVTNKPFPLYYRVINLTDTLKSIFAKISKILLSEKKLNEIKKDELTKLSVQSLYVTRATKVMHHIRNRLTPISNLIKMLDKSDTISDFQKKEFRELLRLEKERAKNELENITKRANYLLEKTNNPFNFTEIKPLKLQSCFAILSKNVASYFPERRVKVIWTKPSDIDDVCIKINHEGFELFLSDWLNNMHKYNNGIVDIVFHIQEHILSIEFWNNYINTENDVSQMISDLMSRGRNEIMKRTTHGLYQIKTCLEEMEIDFHIKKADSDNELICLVINFKLNQYENSNI